MRIKPVYLLLDVSDAMRGAPLDAVADGLRLLLSKLSKDPQALECVRLSVVTFGAGVTRCAPLADPGAFQVPPLTAGGPCPLGGALEMAAFLCEGEVKKPTADAKGDYKPLISIVNRGRSSDDVERGVEAFLKRKWDWGWVRACASGPGPDLATLRRITRDLTVLGDEDSDGIRGFFSSATDTIWRSIYPIDSNARDPEYLLDRDPPDQDPSPPEINLLKP